MLAGASVRQLFFWSPVVGKSCLLAFSLPHSSCDGERKPGCLIDSRDGQSFVTRQGTLGGTSVKAACVCRHNGTVSFHQRVLVLSA